MPRHHQDPWLPGSFNTIDLSPLGLPEVPLLGIYHHLRTKPALNEHTHPDLMEITYLARGEQQFAVGNTSYRLQSGEVFVTFPGEYHSTGRQPYGRNLNYWVQLRLPAANQTFLGLSRSESHLLSRALRALPNRHFRGEQTFCLAVENIFRLYNAPEEPLQRLRAAQLLVGLLLQCTEWSRTRPVTPATDLPSRSGDIRTIMEFIRAHAQENFSIPELAARIHLSPSRFKAKFKDETGIPPGDFLLRIKIEAAQTLLRTTSAAITEIAYQLGFSSSQYFATVFRRFTNCCPGDFRRQT